MEQFAEHAPAQVWPALCIFFVQEGISGCTFRPASFYNLVLIWRSHGPYCVSTNTKQLELHI